MRQSVQRSSLVIALRAAMMVVLAGAGLLVPTALGAQEAGRVLTTDEAVRERAEDALRAGSGEMGRRPVFGANLFTGAFSASRATQDDDYPLQIGDKVLIRIYGAENTEAVSEVDGQGNLFVPGVGPTEVLGRRAGDLHRLVEAEVRKTYTSNVKVYAALLSPGAIGIYVTGNVVRPGRYLGSSLDDILFYLDQAGGIDGLRGSFRSVALQRGGQTVETVDLYDFLLDGRLPRTPLKDGDVVVVGPRGPVVQAVGNVAAPYGFELNRDVALGGAVIRLARPDSTVTNVALQGVRDGAPFARYYTLDEFVSAEIRDGDQATFRADQIGATITVAVEANVGAPSLYVVPRDARLTEVLALIPIDASSADPDAIYIRRQSVARQQKEALRESLNRLERQVLTSSSQNAEQATLQRTEAELLDRFIQRARDLEPSGIVSVFDGGTLTDIQLEDGDVVVIPDRTEIISVAGEVIAPGAFALIPDGSLRDYVDRAGGFAENANEAKLVVRKKNGTTVQVGQGYRAEAGDQILVLPEVDKRFFALTKDIGQIVFQAALSTATVLGI
ncbi:MAG: SLBB domain-containing protein [Alphaproteobacteria bacterium]|nr:SLBB domain-containing protein [Alphaproteobacteria bacterium]